MPGWAHPRLAAHVYVSFTATAPEMAEHGGLNTESVGGRRSAEAEDDGLVYQSYEVGPGEYKIYQQRTSTDQDPERTHMHVITVIPPEAEGDPYSDAPVRTRGADDVWPGDGGGNPTRDTRRGSGRLPGTGDPTPKTLPLGLALAGAALTAYGARRAANEAADEANEEAQGD